MACRLWFIIRSKEESRETIMEQVSYKKLFKLLIDRNERKTEFAAKAGISQKYIS